ncbi:uncharacterized protein (TIGR03084 family) [Knoellia remsis]|uniref:Uncharacterized protein (TIGR03084 family) n=1 Tax=Knoellia remsis TaxID=407159 RepID=A0A2T0V0W0_9MICO|nr:TIGR03084 family metal-binding protein [Knoellia remsis]PRY63825.1 uncharacterized protein (TIGR03084 family) [Knoellia remsis]
MTATSSTGTTLDAVLSDLAAESAQLDAWVGELVPEQWATPTPAPGWTIAHQVGHLAWTDDIARTAATDAEAFAAAVSEAASTHGMEVVDAAAAQWGELPPTELLARWRTGRDALAGALRAVPAGEKVVWFGPPMSPTSMATARLMETWAHGHDVADALGVTVPVTDRVRHVAHLGVITRGFAHAMRGEEPPPVDIRVELAGPRGDIWTWGAPDAPEKVTGTAYDFARLATRRIHRDDADVRADGPHADHWLDIVQAFAGPPGQDPKPRSQGAS